MFVLRSTSLFAKCAVTGLALFAFSGCAKFNHPGAQAALEAAITTPLASPTAAPIATAQLDISDGPGIYHFGSVTLGVNVSKTFTVTNSGAATATLGTVTNAGLGLAAPVTLTGGTCTTGALLSPAGTCTVTVTYAPVAATTTTQTMRFDYTDSTRSDSTSRSMDGIGLTPATLVFSPVSKAFGNVTVGTSSSAQAFTVTNSGGTAAANVFLALSTGTQFAVSNPNCGTSGAKISVAAGATCTFDATFTPLTAGAKSDTLTLTYDNGVALAQTATAALSGTGLTPASLAFSPVSKDFSDVAVSTPSSVQAFTVTNSGGTAAANVFLGLTTGTQFAVSNPNCGTSGAKISVAAGGTCTFDVTFTPTTVGAKSDTLTLTYDNGVALAQSATAALAGNGMVAPSGLSYTSNLAYAVSQAIVDVTPAVTGASLTFTVAPALPAGLTIHSTTGVLSGTPTAATSPAMTFKTFTVTATNAVGSTTFDLSLMVVNATYIVNNTTDAGRHASAGTTCRGAGLAIGQCTLRAAAAAVQRGDGGATPTIFLLDNTYILTVGGASAFLSMDNTNSVTAITIVGQSQANTIISGNSASQILHVSDVNFTMSNLTLKDGWCGSDSGGALNYSTSSASQKMALSGLVFKNNRSTGGYWSAGGAVYMSNAAGNPTSSTISNSVFDANFTDQFGGAIDLDSARMPKVGLVVTRSVFKNNTGDYGGAMCVTGSATVSDSLFQGNTATYGGSFGINTGDLTLVNTTHFGNTASSRGGAVYANNGLPSLDFAYNTFRQNSAGSAGSAGAIEYMEGTLRSFAGLFVDNTTNSTQKHCGGTAGNYTSLGYNFTSSTGGACVTANGTTDNASITLAAILLSSSLASNGGATQTLAIQNSSPLISAIPSGSCGATTADARGVARPTGLGCEPGAFEY
jgi:hypothetical protein